MNRPVQPPQNQPVGGSLPYRRPSSVTGQPNMAHNQTQLNGGPHFAQNQGTSCTWTHLKYTNKPLLTYSQWPLIEYWCLIVYQSVFKHDHMITPWPHLLYIELIKPLYVPLRITVIPSPCPGAQDQRDIGTLGLYLKYENPQRVSH